MRHTKGCNCKKSSCLKKYCECFQGGIFCTEICKCVDCKNYDVSLQPDTSPQAIRMAARRWQLICSDVDVVGSALSPAVWRPQCGSGGMHTRTPFWQGRGPTQVPVQLHTCPVLQSSSCSHCTHWMEHVCVSSQGSEARAQVLSVHDTFNVQQLHQAAQQHALKRQRVMQGVPQLAGTAGLIQAQNALQQLAAAAAAGGSNAPSMPLQQLQALQAAAAAASAPQQPPASPQPASR